LRLDQRALPFATANQCAEAGEAGGTGGANPFRNAGLLFRAEMTAVVGFRLLDEL